MPCPARGSRRRCENWSRMSSAPLVTATYAPAERSARAPPARRGTREAAAPSLAAAALGRVVLVVGAGLDVVVVVVVAGSRRRPGCTSRRGRSSLSSGDVPTITRPAGVPVARSVSSACCRMTTAAAWSTTARRVGPSPPVAQHSLRGHAWSAARRRAAPAPVRAPRARRGRALAHLDGRRSLAAGQRARQPDDDLDGLLARPPAARSGRRSPLPRRTVSTGVARKPVGSLRATPIRASPGSMPEPYAVPQVRASPGRTSRPAVDLGADQGQRLVDPATRRCRRPGRRRPCRRPAADQRADRADQRVGADAARARRVVDRGDDRRPCRRRTRDADHDDHAGLVAAAAGRARRAPACARRPRPRRRRAGRRP